MSAIEFAFLWSLVGLFGVAGYYGDFYALVCVAFGAFVWIVVLLLQRRRATGLADGVYRERNHLAQFVAVMANKVGCRVGLGVDEEAGYEWPVLYIDLPAGQVSWHISLQDLWRLWPEYPGKWDGHAKEDVEVRLRSAMLLLGTDND